MQLFARFLGTIVLFVGISLLVNNLIVYLSIKQILVSSMEEQSQTVARDLREAIQRYQASVKFVEDLIGQELRVAAIAAKSELDPKAENVTNEQLVELAKKLGVSHITLLQKRGDDIVGVKSSDPKEINMSTKHWGYWFTAFQQLLEKQEVTIPQGQKLPNYWSGPIEYADTDPTKIDKWGYYYDGTTDYIINPYVEDRQIREFEQFAGPNAILEKTLSNHPHLLEVTGFNYNRFGKPLKISKAQNGESFVSLYDKPIYFGTYTYAEPDKDVENVRKAIEQNRTISYKTKVNDRTVLKSFIPVISDSPDQKTNFPYVIGIVYDYEGTRSVLYKQLCDMIARFVAISLFCVLLVFFMTRMVMQNKEEAVRVTQEAYIEEMNKMFTMVRGQRHDFLNHVQTIHSFVQMGKYDDLKRYTAELIGEVRQVNDIIKIGHPAIAAIVQSKLIAAMSNHINFRHEFSEFDNLTLGIKSVDIVIIIGNLVDNAFDEVMNLPPEQRWVELKGWRSDRNLYISVLNMGSVIREEDLEKIFESGYSTKQNHSGIGLAIVKERVNHYKGSIVVKSDPDHGTEFIVSIPLE